MIRLTPAVHTWVECLRIPPFSIQAVSIVSLLPFVAWSVLKATLPLATRCQYTYMYLLVLLFMSISSNQLHASMRRGLGTHHITGRDTGYKATQWTSFRHL
ncbi:hypothetical protein F4801DRAFT_542207 [Xylaria longipes]|nr:hypothetical protein F4801DRAFT_542207 [Xylaria longipes]